MIRFRSYGPGKYDTELDSYVHELTLDTSWLNEEMGDVQCLWAGRIDGAILPEHCCKNWDSLTSEEERTLADMAGCILTENSQGFVSVVYCDTSEQLRAIWQDLAEDLDEVSP